MSRCYLLCCVALLARSASLGAAPCGPDDNGPAAAAGDTFYVCEFVQTDRWEQGKPIRAQAGFAEHLAFMARLKADGALAMAGPFTDEAGGGVTLLRAASADDARRILSQEPFVQRGLLALDSARPWHVGMNTLCPSAETIAARPMPAEHETARSARPNGRAADGSRVLSKEVIVQARIEAVWRCWTTSEGIASFFSPNSTIELRVGGPYELYMGATAPDESGKRGSEGCRVLSFVPHEMLSFEWNFSPATPGLRASGAKTHVVLRFDDLGANGVRVRFDQLGWQEGEEWDAGYAYFDKAWDWVLGSLKKRLEGEAAAVSAGG